jgi:hypothetical protein
MSPSLLDIFAGSTPALATTLLAAAVLLAVVGLRRALRGRDEGYLYLTLAVSIALAHAVVAADAPETAFPEGVVDDFRIWLAALMAPSLVMVFCFRAGASFFAKARRQGLIRLFFGITLLCYLDLLGPSWPVDLKALITLVWVGFLLKIELPAGSHADAGV